MFFENTPGRGIEQGGEGLGETLCEHQGFLKCHTGESRYPEISLFTGAGNVFITLSELEFSELFGGTAYCPSPFGRGIKGEGN
jgi:hypothetical protein